MANFLSNIPKPLLKKASKLLQEAIEETENKSGCSSSKKTLSAQCLSRIIYREEISMNEIINWAKAHYPTDIDGATFIVVKDNSDNLDYDFLLYLLYVQENTPLLGENYSSMAIYSKKIDETLSETFGNNDIIEFE